MGFNSLFKGLIITKTGGMLAQSQTDTDGQTVQAQTCNDTLGHENNSKFCLRNTELLVSDVPDWAVISCKCCVFFLVKCFV